MSQVSPVYGIVTVPDYARVFSVAMLAWSEAYARAFY